MRMKDLKYEIHMFLGKGRVNEKSHYPIGEIHAFILYLRQPKNSELDWITAEDLITDSGIDEVEFSKAGKLDSSRVGEDNMDPYENALEKGSSLIVYSDPL
jgi:hypothetical protein